MIGLELLQGKSGEWKYYIHASELVMYIVRLKAGTSFSYSHKGMHSVDGFHWGVACSRPFVNGTGW